MPTTYISYGLYKPTSTSKTREKSLRRQSDQQWRRALCVELARDAITANKAEMGIKHDYLSPSFLLLMSKFSK